MGIKILFMRSEQAYLPEVDAYLTYFNQLADFQAFDSSKLSPQELNYADYDIIWEFKGFGGVKRSQLNDGQILIHEYLSLSTGSFPQFKDKLKSWFNEKPDMRIFLNKYIQQSMNFKDDVPYHFRDMGVAEAFLTQTKPEERNGFVYVGAITPERDILTILDYFSKQTEAELYLIGHADDEIKNRYLESDNIRFLGKKNYDQIPELLNQFEYGINFIPDKFPFNKQTSTKLLEYVALDLKIISTKYEWVQHFEQENNLSFYYMDDKNPQINFNELDQYNFKGLANKDDLTWDNIITSSGILDTVNMLINKRM